MAEISIRPALDGDLPGILQTLKAALGETPLLRRTPELWAWKHRSNPFGASMVFVAESQDRIAGVRAMMRWHLTTPQGETVYCLRPVDTATHPDFTRRGIFHKLTLTALDMARDEGVHLVFNTPNEKSAPGYLKMGWEEVARIGVLVRPRLRSAVRPDPNRPPSIRELAPDLTPVADSPITAPDRHPIGLRTPRSADYLAWRFASHPTASYGWMQHDADSGLVARAGARHGRSELVVSDLIGDPGRGVIQSAARTARARYLAGWFSPGTPERKTAIWGGMLPVPGLRTLRLVALPLTGFDTDVLDLGSWDLSTSDLELL